MKRSSVVVAALVGLLLAIAGPARADYQAGMEAYARGDYPTAAKEFGAVAQAHPDDPQFAIAFHMLGLTQLKLEDSDAAVANLAHAVKLDGGNAEFALGLGQALLSTGDAKRAFSVLKGIDPAGLPEAKRTPHALLLASAALKSKRGKDAVAALQTRLAAVPDEPVLHRALGSTYYHLGRRDEAFEAFAAAFAADPYDTVSGRAAVRIGLSLAARADDAKTSGQLYAQITELSTTLAEHSPGAETALLAGDAALGSHDFATALTWFEKAQAEGPADPAVLLSIGRALGELGRPDDAVAAYEQALATSPEPELARRIYSRMGALCATQLDFDRAIPAYEKAGRTKRADELRTLREQYGDAAAQRRDLAIQATKLEEMGQRLEDLGEEEGATKVRERIAYINRQIDAIDRNLARVRQVLRQD